jgi:hypothetical protein
MDITALRQELIKASVCLHTLGLHDEADLLLQDMTRAGYDLRELLMVRDDAERLLGADENLDDLDDKDHPSLTAAERNSSLT